MEEVITDQELAARLRISAGTLRKYLREGPPRVRHGSASGDVRTIRSFVVGGQRRWVKSSVDEFIHGDQ